MDVANFLRALMRDVAWGFFYGWVNFDHVIGTTNHYKTVDLYAGTYNATLKAAGVDRLENFPTEQIAPPSSRCSTTGRTKASTLRRAAGDRIALRPQTR
jgi:hypothetical protein